MYSILEKHVLYAASGGLLILCFCLCSSLKKELFYVNVIYKIKIPEVFRIQRAKTWTDHPGLATNPQSTIHVASSGWWEDAKFQNHPSSTYHLTDLLCRFFSNNSYELRGWLLLVFIHFYCQVRRSSLFYWLDKNLPLSSCSSQDTILHVLQSISEFRVFVILLL